MAEDTFEPGAARFGNFINYYQFHPAENRISLLPNNFLDMAGLSQMETVVCIDVGCNTGVSYLYVEFIRLEIHKFLINMVYADEWCSHLL